jgi:phosphoribosylamine--glycine ligase
MGDGDTGPNTGGMGAYSPAPVVTPEIEQQVGLRVVRALRGWWGGGGCSSVA